MLDYTKNAKQKFRNNKLIINIRYLYCRNVPRNIQPKKRKQNSINSSKKEE